MDVSRTITSKIILLVGLFAACFSNAQTPTPTPSGISMQGTPAGLSAFLAGTEATGTVSATLPTIYGGYVGAINGCASPSSTSTCDSCAGGTTLAACNPTSIHPTLLLSMTLVSTSITGTPRVRWKFSGETSGHAINNTPSLVNNVAFNVEIKWADLCAAAGGNGTCTLDIATTKTLSVGIDTDNDDATIEQKVDFNFVFRYVTGADTLTPPTCTAGTAPSSATEGICDYTMLRGDEKVYISDFAASSNDLSTANAAVKYNRIAMFYVTNAAANTITTSSPSLILNLTNNSPSEPTIADQRITGLANDVKYCFALGNMDQTGNITYFPPAADLALPANDTKYCATPSQVVGLLDDKHCFIATATYGSVMAPEVETFREFRNKFLLSNAFGKFLVSAYYKFGPEAAEWIAKSDLLKTLSVGILWPVLLFVKLSLAWGIWTALFVALAFGLLISRFAFLALQKQAHVKGDL